MRLFKNKKGFTIFEVMISVSIVTIGLIGILSLVHQSIKAQYTNKNELIASQLAQEGVELARNIRDDAWITGGGSVIDVDGKLAIYFKGNNINIQQGLIDINDSRAELNIDNNGYYIHGSAGGNIYSGFNRIVEVEVLSEGTKVTSTVQWIERGRKEQYVVETILYNWY